MSIGAVEMYIQGEQLTLAKLKMIIMGHRGVAGYIYIYIYFLSYNQGQEIKIYSKLFMYVSNKKLL